MASSSADAPSRLFAVGWNGCPVISACSATRNSAVPAASPAASGMVDAPAPAGMATSAGVPGPSGPSGPSGGTTGPDGVAGVVGLAGPRRVVARASMCTAIRRSESMTRPRQSAPADGGSPCRLAISRTSRAASSPASTGGPPTAGSPTLGRRVARPPVAGASPIGFPAAAASVVGPLMVGGPKRCQPQGER